MRIVHISLRDATAPYTNPLALIHEYYWKYHSKVITL